MQLVKRAALFALSTGIRLPEPLIDRYIELAHLKVLLASLKIDCVLDVGANRGQFASELRAIGYRGQIVSFEPLREEFLRACERFAGDNGWSGHCLALGKKNEMASINVPNLTVFTSLLEPMHREQGTRTEKVEVRRLDEIPLPRGRLFLKMDTQGYDLEVFEGAAGCLDNIHGIQSELSVIPIYKGMPDYRKALDCYESAGFHLHNLSVVNRIDGEGILELNCFMKRPSSE